jgi:hypothetical protein
MTYVDHYEIEVKLGGRWMFICSKYPDYEWASVRPWYFLWLRRVSTIVEPVCPALCTRLDAVIDAARCAYAVRPNTAARVWQFNRHCWFGFEWLRKRLSWSTPNGKENTATSTRP